MDTATPCTAPDTSRSFGTAYAKTQPKRVILRLRVNEFEGEGRDWEQHVDAIKAYLTWAGRPTSEYEGIFETRRHYAHVEPFQAPELKQTTFHVVLDMEQRMLDEANFDALPHEIYRVRRNKEENLEVRTFENPHEAQNIIRKTRMFTDVVYPWAGQKYQKLGRRLGEGKPEIRDPQQSVVARG